MANDETILITGATGRQGGATLRHLAKRGGFKLRAMTRKPDGAGARAVAALGAQVVAGDLNDAASIERAVKGAWGVFSVQNAREAGVEGEEEQGKRLAKIAKDAGVQHFVYTSVGSAERRTGIPHFDNKARIEETVKKLGFPSHVILRPVFFMENLPMPGFLNGDKLTTALKPETKVQMIAVDDIGKFGAAAFAEAEKFKGAEIEYAGDAVTMDEAAAALGELTGKPVTYQRIPIEAVRANSDDFARMLEWFDAVGYRADIPSLETRWGIRPITLAQWVRSQKK
jgi:uncharacterized protein YbjT (DUF2867 family)